MFSPFNNALNKAGLAYLPNWFVAPALALVVLCLLLLVVTRTFYAKPVQRMLRDLRKQFVRGAAQVKPGLTSPYERELSESRFLSLTLALIMYTLSALLLGCSGYLVLIAFNLLEPTPLLSLPRLLSGSFFALVYVFLAKVMKVDGDKVQYNLSQKTTPQSSTPRS